MLCFQGRYGGSVPALAVLAALVYLACYESYL